jgi:dTDP-4-dehydrorhamnose reductase
MNQSALIGSTGFVGSNLLWQHSFDAVYHSKNINEITGNSFNLVVCAGVRAEKWKANLEPENDLQNINLLINYLRQIKTSQFILISTVDVYPNPVNVYEDSNIMKDNLSAYGRNRFHLEEFIREAFFNHIIIRLPGLIGTGLKKNFIYDMLHKPEGLLLTHSDSYYQFYSVKSLWTDIQKVRSKGLKLINFATSPLSVHRIASECFGREFLNNNSKPPIFYDMRTRYADLFGRQGDYICTESEEISEIRSFVEIERNTK